MDRTLYLLGLTGRDNQLSAYLGFGAAFTGDPIPTRTHGDFRVISVPAEHVSWQALRLMSGLRGGQMTYETEEDARAAALSFAPLL